jgi:hypothetical protein
MAQAANVSPRGSMNGGKARPIRLLLNTGRRRHGDHRPAGIVRPAPGSVLYSDADAFDHGGTPDFAALSAVALRRNDVNNPQPHQSALISFHRLRVDSRRKVEQDGTRNQRTKVFPPNSYKDIPAVVEAMPQMPTLRVTEHS